MATRTEEWAHETEGMIGVFLVDVDSCEQVHIREEVVDEFGFDRALMSDQTEDGVCLFPYTHARDRFQALGATRV